MAKLGKTEWVVVITWWNSHNNPNTPYICGALWQQQSVSKHDSHDQPIKQCEWHIHEKDWQQSLQAA